MVTAPQTFTYSQASGLALQLDYYAPPSGSAQPAPFLFSIHGGGGSGGDRKDVRLWSLALAQAKGWGFISADYRLIPECDATCAVQDMLEAWRFTTQELNATVGEEVVDPAKGIVLGISAGGWTATLLGAVSGSAVRLIATRC
jgi:acetyl esterase/lipase